jgi:peroxiredoxin
MFLLKAGGMEQRKTQKTFRFDYRSITLLFLILIMIGVFVLLFKGEDSFLNLSTTPSLRPNLRAPNFTFPGLDGKMVSLTDYKGKVVLLNIWATWCPPCVEEMPSMEKLYRELKGEEFEILAVSIDALAAKAVAPFVKKHNLSFPVLLNPDGTMLNLYGTTGVPESFVIDKKGNIEEIIIGSRDWATLEVIRLFRNLMKYSSSLPAAGSSDQER